jgi:hypothetical protein
MSAFGSTGLTINLQTTSGLAGAGGGTLFVAPTFAGDPAGAPAPTTVYVYATVTGTGSTSASDFNGLQYLYYNVNGTGSSTAPSSLGGTVTGAALNTNFNGGASIGDPGSGYGDQAGTTTGATAPGLVLGSATALTSMAKPRAGSPVWANAAGLSANPSSIYTNGTSTSFLVETLSYQGGGAASTATSVLQSNLAASVPSLGAYVGANWFQDASTTTTPSAAIQNGSYGAGSNVTLTTALGGDANLDGNVNISDFNILAHNFAQPGTFSWAQGDFNGDGSVNISDFNILAHNFTLSLGTGPLAIADAEPLISFAEVHNDVAGFEAATGIEVPEPTSLGLLAVGGLALLGRRKRVSG